MYGFVDDIVPPGPAGGGLGPWELLTGKVAKRPPRGPDTLLPSDTVNELGWLEGGPENDPNSLTDGAGIIGDWEDRSGEPNPAMLKPVSST